MNVAGIVREYLRANGYDGLYNDDSECGCTIGDFAPCGGLDAWECSPGARYRDGVGWLVGSREYAESLKKNAP